MVTLFCAVVGVGSVFPVDIDIRQTVGHLKKKIKEEDLDLFSFGAARLKLYLARESDTWLNSRHDASRVFKKGEIPDRIKSLMTEELLLDEAWDLNDDAYFGNNLERVKGDIHVLVELPEDNDFIGVLHNKNLNTEVEERLVKKMRLVENVPDTVEPPDTSIPGYS